MSSMSDSMKALKEFMDLIAQSSLKTERKEFWLEKLKKGEFSAEDHQDLVEEVDAAIRAIDAKIAAIDEEIENQKGMLQNLEVKMIEQIKQGKTHLAKEMKVELDQFEKDTAEIEQEAIDQIESGDVEKIKDSLSKKKEE